MSHKRMLHQLPFLPTITIHSAIPGNAMFQPLRIRSSRSELQMETQMRKMCRKNIIRRNATVQQFNASIARTHMKHGIMSALHESPRSTDLRNCGIALPISSLSNLLILSLLSLTQASSSETTVTSQYRTHRTKNMG